MTGAHVKADRLAEVLVHHARTASPILDVVELDELRAVRHEWDVGETRAMHAQEPKRPRVTKRGCDRAQAKGWSPSWCSTSFGQPSKFRISIVYFI